MTLAEPTKGTAVVARGEASVQCLPCGKALTECTDDELEAEWEAKWDSEAGRMLLTEPLGFTAADACLLTAIEGELRARGL